MMYNYESIAREIIRKLQKIRTFHRIRRNQFMIWDVESKSFTKVDDVDILNIINDEKLCHSSFTIKAGSTLRRMLNEISITKYKREEQNGRSKNNCRKCS